MQVLFNHPHLLIQGGNPVTDQAHFINLGLAIRSIPHLADLFRDRIALGFQGFHIGQQGTTAGIQFLNLIDNFGCHISFNQGIPHYFWLFTHQIDIQHFALLYQTA